MDLQGQPISAGPRSTKVTTDPQASQHPIREPSGPVSNDSLAAESTRTGGGYSENRGAEPLGVSGAQSTLNNTNTSGATTLPSAPVGTSRENLDRKERYPEALGGQGNFPGPHVPETGYVGGPTSTKDRMGMHSNEYPASQKLGGGADGYHSQYNGGQAPSYVQDVLQNQGDLKPKGKNIKEGGFDSNDPNASFGTDIGSKNDPGRKAERGFQQATAESGPYGSSARSEKGQDNQHWYQPLERDTLTSLFLKWASLLSNCLPPIRWRTKQEPNFQAEVDEDDLSFFRLLIHNQTIKYIAIVPGIYSTEDMCFGPTLASLLPNLPPGNWNDGLIACRSDNQPQFTRTTQTPFPSVESTWHDISIDYLDAQVGQKLRTGIYEINHTVSNTTVVAKFARFDWEIGYLDNETRAYQWINGWDIGPRFLGHLTEHGRVVGFLIERVYNARHAGPDDLRLCQGVLGRLHRLGIRHGDINWFNFLVVGGERAVLIGFDQSRKCSDGKALEREFDDLSSRLADSSRRGGGGLL